MNTATDPRTSDDPPLSDNLLGQVDIRVDIARMDVYRLIINAKGYDDLYLDEIFNRFIGAAQAPLNFAIYDREGGLLFHLVNDPKYHPKITKRLKNKSLFKKSFDLFPNLLGGKYRILVLHMKSKLESKSNWFEVINFESELTAWTDPNPKSQEIVKKQSIGSQETYLKRCAWRFFNCPWDGFETQLHEYAKTAIENSISELSRKFRPCSSTPEDIIWPPDPLEVAGCLSVVELPNTKPRAAGWHKKLRQISYRELRAMSSGLNAQHLLMHGREGGSYKVGDGVPNMLVSYRTFCRPHNSIRGKLGYLYDTQFLIPDKTQSDENTLWNLFERLRGHSEFLDENTENTFAGERSKRLYRNVFSEAVVKNEFPASFSKLSPADQDVRHRTYRYITNKMDTEFWRLLASRDGVSECIEVFRSPVGDNARSLSDSAYHTGLIHTNFVFEYAGFDRILGMEDILTQADADRYISENRDDLLRVVMFFYAMSEMVNWKGSLENFDPRKIAAVLMPIKMRGSVWAVTIHATYVPNLQKNFQHLAYWLSYYHLTASLSVRNGRNFDLVLWENAQARVARTLEKALVKFPRPEQLRQAYDEFNYKMMGEQRLVPYALPQLRYGTAPEDADDHIICLGIDDEEYALCWDIAENPFYSSAQGWNRKGTRSFANSVRAGLDRGFENQIWE